MRNKENVTQCDRCSEPKSSEWQLFLRVFLVLGDRSHPTVDLCKRCGNSLRAWLYGGAKTPADVDPPELTIEDWPWSITSPKEVVTEPHPDDVITAVEFARDGDPAPSDDGA